MKKVALLSLVASSIVMAGGYKIPENSTNAVALGAANIAHNHNSADAAYYNPAKMIFMSSENHIDANLIYIGLEEAKYEGDVTFNTTPLGSQDIKSETEDFLIPSLHYVSSSLGENGARVGMSIVSSGGLSKRWKDSVATMSAEEFSMQTIEFNPSVAFELSEKVGIAFGFRAISSSAVAKATPASNLIYQDMEGDSLDFGYNLALAYQPTKELEIGMTYRSKIALTLDGTADLKYTDLATGTTVLDGSYDGAVTLPLPASFDIAMAYTFSTQTVVEFVYERTMWSSYKELNFEYSDPTAEAIFGSAKDKSWSDANSYRLGITQKLEDFTVMGGVVIDKSPIPEENIGFELPGSDSVSYSLGMRYQVEKNLDLSLAGLYSIHEQRDVENDSLDGSFSGANVLFISMGVGYRF